MVSALKEPSVPSVGHNETKTKYLRLFSSHIFTLYTESSSSHVALLVIDKIELNTLSLSLEPFCFWFDRKEQFLLFCLWPLTFVPHSNQRLILLLNLFTQCIAMASKFKSLDSSSSTEQQNYKHIKWKL